MSVGSLRPLLAPFGKITRIETISAGTVDPLRVGFADLSEEDCSDWLLRPNDILFSHINSVEHIGKCAIYEGYPEKLVHGMNLLCLRCNPDEVVPQYARSLIKSPGFRDRLSNFINKAVNQASVSIGNLKAIKVEVPPLSEQRRIAAILDKTDELRAQQREAVKYSGRLRQAIFEELLNIAGYRPSQSIPLTDFFHFRTGKLDSNAAVPNGEYPFFTCSREDLRIDSYAFDCEALLLAGNNASADYSVKHYKGKFNAYQRTYVLTLKDATNSYSYAHVALEGLLSDMKRFSKGTNTKYRSSRTGSAGTRHPLRTKKKPPACRLIRCDAGRWFPFRHRLWTSRL